MLGMTTLKTKQGPVRLMRYSKELRVPRRNKAIPLSEVTYLDLEEGSTARKRLTATRLAALGVFAVFFKKTVGGEKYLVVETQDEAYAFEVDRKDERDARQFVLAVRQVSR